ncbi:MAG: biopolymer transporter ExbD [Pseudomonadota bacterium]
MKKRRQSTKAEPTVSLINIVFLILIFFMVAGTLSTPSEQVAFVQTEGLECCTSPDAVVVTSSGSMFWDDREFSSVRALLDAKDDDLSFIRILPDKDLPANQLLSLIGTLKDNGAQRIVVVTEHTL